MSNIKRILCVDESPDICELLTHMLRHSGLDVIAVANITEALHLMKQEQFSLYILDTQMAGISGLSICGDIRRIDQHTPIIIYSGMGYQSDIDAGLLAGANVYLVKPRVDEIIPTVRQLLKQAAK